MQQTIMTTVINQEQSDLVTSATLSASAVQKDSIKNGKTVLITNTSSKSKITSIISNSSNKSNSNKSSPSNNNNNSTTTNKNSTTKAPVQNGRSDVIVTSLQHKSTAASNAPTISQLASNGSSEANNNSNNGKSTALPDARQVLKEAVDAVVNSFTKHTQGYGRGECYLALIIIIIFFYIHSL